MINEIENEVWKQIDWIDGAENYYVSNMGRVLHKKGRQCRADRVLRASKNGVGYYYVAINRKSYSVHSLVARAFKYDMWQPGFEVSHLDDDTNNNCADNLIYESHASNCDRAARRGTNRGKQRIKVRCIETGEEFNSIYAASKKYGIAPGNLTYHLQGKTHRYAGLHWEKITQAV